MGDIKVVMGTSESQAQKEVEFARGDQISNQNILVTYTNLNEMQPQAKFPTIYKTWGDNSVTSLSLTPDEGRFLASVLARMFPDLSKVAR